MSYIKLGQIADVILAQPQNIAGSVYIEDENGIVVQSINPTFPLNVTVEVIDWVDQSEQQKHGKVNAFHVEAVTIPDQSVSIRQSVLNQLVSKYPSLVM